MHWKPYASRAGFAKPRGRLPLHRVKHFAVPGTRARFPQSVSHARPVSEINISPHVDLDYK